MSSLLLDVSALQAIVRGGHIERAEKLWSSQAHWSEAVAAEVPARLQPRFGWLGEPIEISDDHDIAEVDRIRRAIFGGLRERPTQYLAEAQILFLMSHDGLIKEPVWLTADTRILDFAMRRSVACLSLQSALDPT